MNKRFASLAVSALLLVSLLSVPALAEGTEAAADTASDDHVIVTLNPEAALQPETPAEAAASATETAQADPCLLYTSTYDFPGFLSLLCYLPYEPAYGPLLEETGDQFATSAETTYSLSLIHILAGSVVGW